VAHVALALAYYTDGQGGEALQSAIAALRALPMHLEASLWLVSSLLWMLTAVLVLGSIAFIGVVAIGVASHAAHDLGDGISRSMPEWARAALLGSLVLLPLSLGEGLLGFALGLFALGFAYGGARHRLALTAAAGLILLGMYPVAQLSARALLAFESDPVAAAALSVLRGIETPMEVEQLERAAHGDLVARYALATRSQRIGSFEEAERRTADLIRSRPRDPVLLANLANLYFRAGDSEAADELYARASSQLESATLLFNQSQIYARSFRMDEFDKSMRRAQQVDPELVAELSQNGNPDFVADLPFPVSLLRTRFAANSAADRFAGTMLRRAAPGWLGESWQMSTGCFLIAALGALLVTRLFRRSSRCTYCGCRVCRRCRSGDPAQRICTACDCVLNRPETTDASLRKTRLAELRRREARVDVFAFWGAVLVPGAGGLMAGRPGLGLLAILFIGWALAWIPVRNGVAPDPLAAGLAGFIALISTAVVALLGYLLVISAGLIVRRRA
jgi:hypothetical protein